MSLKTLVNDPFENDPAIFLGWAYGPMASQIFIENITEDDQRRGQAFMNTLRMYDLDSYIRLTGTDADPFYVDDKIPAAIDLITSK